MELKAYLTESRGRAAAVAKALKVNPVTVHQWAFDDKKNIPVDRCPEVEKATLGEVSCEELRSDVTWIRVKDKRWPHSSGRPLVDYFKKAA